AVHVGVAAQQIGRTESFGDVLAGTGRAIHGADDGDVVARAVTAVTPVVAHEVARRCGQRSGRAIAAEGVIALEGISADVMDVDMAACRDVFAGKADNLPVFVDRFAALDVAQSNLVPQADALAEGKRRCVELKLGTGRKVSRGHGDVIFRAQL